MPFEEARLFFHHTKILAVNILCKTVYGFWEMIESPINMPELINVDRYEREKAFK